MAAHLWFCLLTGLMALQGYGAPGELHSAEAVTGMMRQRLEGLSSLSARYSVTTYAAVLDRRSETEGRLFLQRDKNLLRLEEADQTIVSDGESLWTYVHGNRQVIVSPAQDGAAGARPGRSGRPSRPDDFIFNYSNQYRYDLEGREPVDETPCYVLGLTAVAPTDGIPALRIWVDEGTWLTRKVVYTDDMGSETTLRFKDFRVNTELPPGLFTMTTPEDVEWVDLR